MPVPAGVASVPDEARGEGDGPLDPGPEPPLRPISPTPTTEPTKITATPRAIAHRPPRTLLIAERSPARLTWEITYYHCAA